VEFVSPEKVVLETQHISAFSWGGRDEERDASLFREVTRELTPFRSVACEGFSRARLFPSHSSVQIFSENNAVYSSTREEILFSDAVIGESCSWHLISHFISSMTRFWRILRRNDIKKYFFTVDAEY